MRLDGTSLADLDRRERARRIAVVLTDRVDPGLLTVGDVVELGRHPHTGWSGYLTAEDVEIAHAAAAHLGVLAMWDRPFAVLSDGQRQRVLVASALAQRPRVLVLDEPTAFLDLGGRIELTLTLAELAHTAHLVAGAPTASDAAMAVIVATHDLELALAHADRVWLVDGGTVVDRAPAELADRWRARGRLRHAERTRTGRRRARRRPARSPLTPPDRGRRVSAGADGGGRRSLAAPATRRRTRHRPAAPAGASAAARTAVRRRRSPPR